MIEWIVFFLIFTSGKADDSSFSEKTEAPGSSNCNNKEVEPTEANFVEAPVTFPQTSFTCWGRYDGYYADVELDCVVFHYCQTWRFPTGVNETVKWDFVCPHSTTFNQKLLACTPPTSALDCYDSPNYYWMNYNLYNPVPETNAKPQPDSDQVYSPSEQVENIQEPVSYPNGNVQYYPYQESSNTVNNAPSYPTYSDFYGNVPPESYEPYAAGPVEPYPTPSNVLNEYIGHDVNEPSSGNYDYPGTGHGVTGQDLSGSKTPPEPLSASFDSSNVSNETGNNHPSFLNESSKVSETYSTEGVVQYPTESTIQSNKDKNEHDATQNDLTLSIEFDVTFNVNPNGNKHPDGVVVTQTGNDAFYNSTEHDFHGSSESQPAPTELGFAASHEPATLQGDKGNSLTQETTHNNIPDSTIYYFGGSKNHGATVSNREPEPLTETTFTYKPHVAFSTELNSLVLNEETTEQFPTDGGDKKEASTENSEHFTVPAVYVNEEVDHSSPPTSDAESQPASVDPIDLVVTYPVILTTFPDKVDISSSAHNQSSSAKNITSNAEEFTDIANLNSQVLENSNGIPNFPPRPYPIDLNNFQGSGEPPEKNQETDELVAQEPASDVKYFLIN